MSGDGARDPLLKSDDPSHFSSTHSNLMSPKVETVQKLSQEYHGSIRLVQLMVFCMTMDLGIVTPVKYYYVIQNNGAPLILYLCCLLSHKNVSVVLNLLFSF